MYSAALRHYARGISYAAKNNVPAAFFDARALAPGRIVTNEIKGIWTCLMGDHPMRRTEQKKNP